MALDAIIRSGLATIDKVFDSLQTKATPTTVSHLAWIGNQEDGTASYAAPVPLKALVVYEEKEHSTPTGIETITSPVLIFPRAVPPNGTAGRKEPFDPRDIMTLPDGTTGQVSSTPSGVVDPSTNRPYMAVVRLG